MLVAREPSVDTLWGDDIDLRDPLRDRLGPDVFDPIEEALLEPAESDGFIPDFGDFNSEGNIALLRSDLERALTNGRIGSTRIRARHADDCPDAIFRGDPDLPVYASPGSFFDTAGWIDVCWPPVDWLRLQAEAFDGTLGRNIFSGLSASSIERLRDGIRAGDEIPRGAIEMERRRIGGSTLLVVAEQEGRNRGAAAILEGVDRILGRVVVVGD